jgi:hypothetical protein
MRKYPFIYLKKVSTGHLFLNRKTLSLAVRKKLFVVGESLFEFMLNVAPIIIVL